VNFVRIDQVDFTLGHLVSAAPYFGCPKGIGVGIGAFGVQAGDEVMR
jgi:hypothetical protein